jgi:hypothetical protein
MLFAFTASAQQEIESEGFKPVKVQGAPTIKGASNCVGFDQWDVALEGADPSRGGTYEIEAGVPSARPPVAFSVFATANVNPVGGVTFVSVNLSQLVSMYGLGSIQLRVRVKNPTYSPYGNAQSFFLRDPSPGLFPPTIPPVPLYTCGVATGVAGVQPGDKITLKSNFDDPLYEVARAYGTYQYVGDFRGFYRYEKVTANYSTCNGSYTRDSLSSVQVDDHPMMNLPRVSFSGPSAIAGVSSVPVNSVVNGATLQYKFNRSGAVYSGTRGCVGGEPCEVPVPAALGALDENDTLEVTQVLCVGGPGGESVANSVTIAACNGSSPTIRSPKVGDSQIDVIDRARGATLTAYFCPPGGYAGASCAPPGWQPKGTAYDSNIINLFSPVAWRDHRGYPDPLQLW